MNNESFRRTVCYYMYLRHRLHLHYEKQRATLTYLTKRLIAFSQNQKWDLTSYYSNHSKIGDGLMMRVDAPKAPGGALSVDGEWARGVYLHIEPIAGRTRNEFTVYTRV